MIKQCPCWKGLWIWMPLLEVTNIFLLFSTRLTVRWFQDFFAGVQSEGFSTTWWQIIKNWKDQSQMKQSRSFWNSDSLFSKSWTWYEMFYALMSFFKLFFFYRMKKIKFLQQMCGSTWLVLINSLSPPFPHEFGDYKYVFITFRTQLMCIFRYLILKYFILKQPSLWPRKKNFIHKSVDPR